MFKQLVTNTTATRLALAVAPATVSKNAGKKASRRAISISLHTVAVLAMALAFQGLTTAPAGASILTACLEDGELEDVAEGLSPLEPCDEDATQVTWGEAGPGANCPCNIQRAAGFAGWTDPPFCFAEVESPSEFGVLLRPDVFEDPPNPLVEVFFDIVGKVNDMRRRRRCFVRDGDGEVAELDGLGDLTPEEFAACLVDVDELAITLGLGGGCALP